MKKFLLGAICLLVTPFAFSQDAVSGYYITSDGQKITGEYEYGDFSSASNLKFRTGTGEFSKPDPKNIKEYGIDDSYKYVKYTVDIDGTDAAAGKLSTAAEPSFQKRDLFLNVLVEGDAVLYSYTDARNTKYFYKTSGMLVPQQLMYRKYLLNGNRSAENNEYRVQLAKNLVCTEIKDTDVTGLTYTRAALVKFVQSYNACKGNNVTVYSNESGSKFKMLFSAFAGVYASSFGLDGKGVPDMDKDTGVSFGVGAEAELLFPSNKLSVFIRAEYEHLDREVEGTFNPDSQFAHLYYFFNAKSALVSAYVGPRYYFDVAGKRKLFLDASAVMTVATGGLDIDQKVVGSTGNSERESLDYFDFGSALSFNFGVGYYINDRFAVELRVNTGRDILDRFPLYTNSQASKMGLNIKYTF